MEKPIRIYQCEDTVNGILSAVYEAGISGYGHKYIRIQPQILGEAENFELFAEYVPVITEEEKVLSVMKAVKQKISWKAYSFMMSAVLSDCPDRGDAVYQFVTYGFSMGAKVCDALQIPCVKRIFEISRAVKNEAHFMEEFLRFQEVQKEPALLLAVIEPKNKVLSLITDHFADRFPEEWFIIYDKTHDEAVFHYKGGDWELRLLSEEEAAKLNELSEQQEKYVELWQVFFHSIAIEERQNEKLQRNMFRLHYRKHVTEFME